MQIFLWPGWTLKNKYLPFGFSIITLCFQEEIVGRNSGDVEIPGKCEACDQICPDQERLYWHMSSHRLSYCDNCKVIIPHREWRSHPCNIDNEVFSCDKCEYTTPRKYNLKTHIRRVHSDKFACDKCSRKFKTIEKLQKHVEAVHSSCFKCEICNQQFGSLTSKKRHKKASHMQQDSAVVNMNIDTVETSSFTSQGTQDSELELMVPQQVKSQSQSTSEPQSAFSSPSDSSDFSDNDGASNFGIAAPKNHQKNLISLEQKNQRTEVTKAGPGGHKRQGTVLSASISSHQSRSKSLLDFGYKFNSEGRLRKLPMSHLFS